VSEHVAVGRAAPDFTLPGTDGTPDGHRDYTLSEFKGRPVVLVFYPGDNTPVCTRQLNSYTADIDQFRSVEAQVLAISPQSIESHDGFSANQGGFAFPLLADGDKAVGRAYGTLGPVGFYRRSIFVVDGEGAVRYAHRAVAGLWFRPTDEVVEAVRSASAQGSSG
jgi:thioredoxin-dependent peroxiredoxin